MRYLIFTILAVALSACTKSSTPSPILQAITDVACPVETQAAAAVGSFIVQNCGSSVSGATCGAAIQAGWGNANLCSAAGVSAVTSAQILQAKADKVAGKVHTEGLVGNVFCPLADAVVVGLFSAPVPPACGCTTQVSNATINAGVIAACEAAVPI